jgi:peptide/nickel transport system permease protein
MGAQLPETEAGGLASTLAVAPTVAEPAARRRRWTRNLDLIVPGALVGLLLFLCFVWPLFGTVPPPTGGNILDANAPSFSEGHFLGADQVGNDLWSRLLYGGRNSLEIAFAVNIIGLVLGGLLGAFAAFWGSFVRHGDDARPRRPDRLPLAGPGARHRPEPRAEQAAHDLRAVLLQRAGLRAPGARPTLRLRERPFMLAARLAGTRAPRILLRHIAPNILPALTTFALLGVGVTIILEGALSFLGLGIPPPQPELGQHDLRGPGRSLGGAEARAAPSAFLFVTVLAFNLLGDALRARGNAS